MDFKPTKIKRDKKGGVLHNGKMINALEELTILNTNPPNTGHSDT